VPDEGYTDEVGEKVLAEAYVRMGHDVHITLSKVDAIQRSAGGKFRSVISRVPGYQALNELG
jgi:hypothetical protein